MKTLGETWYEMKQSACMKDGALVLSKPEKWPDRMARKDAAEYYNGKLIDYWASVIDESVPKKMRRKAVSFMMFGDHKRCKMFGGENNA
jgi:hypothetical protein